MTARSPPDAPLMSCASMAVHVQMSPAVGAKFLAAATRSASHRRTSFHRAVARWQRELKNGDAKQRKLPTRTPVIDKNASPKSSDDRNSAHQPASPSHDR